MTTTPSDGHEEITFEQQLEDLEAVLDELDSGALSLDDMLSRYERGMQLFGVIRLPNAARFAASTDGHLRLDHPWPSRQRRHIEFVLDQHAGGDRHAARRKQRLRVVFQQVHG